MHGCKGFLQHSAPQQHEGYHCSLQCHHLSLKYLHSRSLCYLYAQILGNGKKIGVTSPMEGAQPTHLQRQHGLLQKTELPPSPEVETSEDPTSPELLPDDHEQTLPSLNEILCS